MTDQILPALPASEAAGEAAMRDWAELLVARARDEGVQLTGEGGLLTGLVRQVPPDRPRGPGWPSIWAMSVTLLRAAGRGTRVTGRRPRR